MQVMADVHLTTSGDRSVKKMQQLLPGLTWRILWLLSWLPGFVLDLLAAFINVVVFGVVGYRTGIIETNLSRSFPELDKQERLKIARAFYRHFSELLPEIILLIRMKPGNLRKRIRLANPLILDEPLRNKQNIIIAGGHYGNWEWNVPLLLSAGYRVLAVYKPQSSIFADLLMKKIRQKPGVMLVPMKDTLRVISDEIKKPGQPFALLLVADQTPARDDIRFWTTFLNQDSAFFTGIDKLSQRFSLPVYYIEQAKHAFANYEARLVMVHDGVTPTAKGDITRRFANLLEESIRHTPYLWLWSHRRWKYRREELPLEA